MTPVQRLAGLAVLVLVLMGGAAGAAWQVQDWRYGERLAGLAKTQAENIASAERRARAEEQRRQAILEKVGSDAREDFKAATADAGIADAIGNRLHVEASKLAASGCSSDSGAAQRGASATRAAMVLSDLFQRADKRAGELAAAYDRAKIAGLSCELAYELVREGNASP